MSAGDEEDDEKTVFQAGPTPSPPETNGDDEDAADGSENDSGDQEDAPEIDPFADDEDDDDGRTVIRPVPPPPDSDDKPVQVPDEPEEDERTVIAPVAPAAAPGDDAIDRTIISPAGDTPAPPPPPPPPSPQEPPQKLLSGISIGEVLNHTYEVKRFIARGGMGEVFEGVNVTNGQRVAIKVILPSLASDPAVIEMFVKEATVLERLVHPALVNYRTQARDPELNVFYIVTNFIEGHSLESVIGKIQPTDQEILGLARRLAEGLAAAHQLGAIHRDIAPDNILLEEGDLARAAIIDFGIARDVDPGSKTVIGTGFAGKLSFVAPEQLGAFDTDIGPWTDVYSLGLVLIGLAQGKTLKLGKSMFEAMEKRKDGVDTSNAPPFLRPLFDGMLAYDPSQRLRSMEEVLAKIDSLSESSPGAGAVPPGKASGSVGGSGKGFGAKLSAGSIPKPALIGGGALLGLLVLGGLGWIAFGGPSADDIPDAAGTTVAASGIDPMTAQQRAEAALANLDCQWITLSAGGSQGSVSLSGSGVAARPEIIEPAIFDALQSGGVSTDFTAVGTIPQTDCGVVDALLPFRVPDDGSLSQPQTSSELERFPSNYEVPGLAGKIGARHAIEVNLPGTTPIALLSLFNGTVAQLGSGPVVNILGEQSREAPGRFRVNTGTQVDQDTWTAFIMLDGGGQLDAASAALASGDYAGFSQIASANNLRARMIWHHLVDNVPN